MQVASRIIGGVLVLCGLSFFAILIYVSAMEGWSSNIGAWVLLGMGIGLVLTGWYYFRLNSDLLEQAQTASSVARFSIAHRRQLKLLAQSGAALSLIHLGAACFGKDWPGKWFLWPLLIGASLLLSLARRISNPDATEDLGWRKVPRWMRAILEPTGKATNAAVFALLLVICWNQWSGHSVGETSVYRFGSRIVAVGCVALLYVLEALFFAHGEARAVET